MNVWSWPFQNPVLDCCASVKNNAFWLWRNFSQLLPVPVSARHSFRSQYICIPVVNLSAIHEKSSWLSSHPETDSPSSKMCRVRLHCVSHILKSPFLVGPSTHPWGMHNYLATSWTLNCQPLLLELNSPTRFSFILFWPIQSHTEHGTEYFPNLPMDAMGDGIKSLAKLKVNSIHCSSFVHQDNYPTVEGNQI